MASQASKLWGIIWDVGMIGGLNNPRNPDRPADATKNIGFERIEPIDP